MEIEGFRLENRVEPFDTGIICWCSFSEHGAGGAFFYTSLIVGLFRCRLSPKSCVKVPLEVAQVDEVYRAQS